MPANLRYANGHRRRQVRARVLAEEDTCWLCTAPVDKTLGIMRGVHSDRCVTAQRECTGCVYHPKSPVVDEVVPVAHGGSPTDRSNCRLAHRDCNEARGDGTRSRNARPPLVPLETSRSW